MAAPPRPLRLLAQDAEDLPLIASTLQDAVLKLGDIRFEPGAHRLTLALNRYRWEAGANRRERVRSALQLGDVASVQTRGIRAGAREAVVSLLTLEFLSEAEPPGGVLHFRFSGGGDLRARVDCIDLALADVSDPWPARAEPRHERA